MQQDNSRLETLQLVQTCPVNGQGLDPLTPVDPNKPPRKTLAIVIFLLSFLTILFDNYHKIDAASFITSAPNPYFLSSKINLPHLSQAAIVSLTQQCLWLAGMSAFVIWFTWIELLRQARKTNIAPKVFLKILVSFFTASSVLLTIPIIIALNNQSGIHSASAAFALVLEIAMLVLLAVIYRTKIFGILAAAILGPLMLKFLSALLHPAGITITNGFCYYRAYSIIEGATVMALFLVLIAIWYLKKTNQRLSAITTLTLLLIPNVVHFSGMFLISTGWLCVGIHYNELPI